MRLLAVSHKPTRHGRERLRLSGWAWATVGLVVTFTAISWWWLTQDLGVPSADAGSHLFSAVDRYDRLVDGDVVALWTWPSYYPPLTFSIGVLSMLVGGVNTTAPVIGANVVYVPLLAIGCYGTARLLAGPRAGFLAALFALGSPLLIEQFHVFMLDAPQAAIVATVVWLILASQRFSHVGISALAGGFVGLGLNSKEQFPLFVAGVVLVAFVRGGWRNWRGLCAFAAVALVVAAPWYLVHWDMLGEYAKAGLANADLPPRGKPPLVSLANLGWYLWATLNGLLFAPLFAFAAVGVAHAVMVVTPVRDRRAPAGIGDRPELLGGLFVGWLGITLTPHHDMRYAMPLIVYLATLGTVWVVALAPAVRRVVTAALVAAVVASTLGASFGVGHEVRILLAGRAIATDRSFGIAAPNQITIYSDRDFVVSGPRREVDAPGFFAALRGAGVTGVSWRPDAFVVRDPAADPQGMALLARFAGMAVPFGSVDGRELAAWNAFDPHHVVLVHGEISRRSGLPPPCLILSDRTGVWVLRSDSPRRANPHYFCPAR